jgi:hypothetical protein
VVTIPIISTPGRNPHAFTLGDGGAACPRSPGSFSLDPLCRTFKIFIFSDCGHTGQNPDLACPICPNPTYAVVGTATAPAGTATKAVTTLNLPGLPESEEDFDPDYEVPKAGTKNHRQRGRILLLAEEAEWRSGHPDVV